MGQKVHPESLRVGYIHDWKSNWFNERNFAEYLQEDTRIREHIIRRLSHAGLSDITIRKNPNEGEVNIHTARPGIVIGKSGSEADALPRDLHRITNKQVTVNILEMKPPELDAQPLGQSVPGSRPDRVAVQARVDEAAPQAPERGGRDGRDGRGGGRGGRGGGPGGGGGRGGGPGGRGGGPGGRGGGPGGGGGRGGGPGGGGGRGGGP